MDAAVSGADDDPEGTPARPPLPGQGDPSATGSPPARHLWLRWAATGIALAILGGAGAGWLVYHKLDGNITTDTATAELLKEYERERPDPKVDEASNILVLGSDDRSGDNRRYGRDGGTARSDTAILLHLSAHRDHAAAVSIPRDLMVDIPACTREDGSRTKAQYAQFNWAYQFGGAACTIRTLEKLTDVRVNHHMVVDFQGFKRLVDSVDGVEVCLSQPVRDPDAKLDLPAGPQTLRGEDALGYVRARKSLGSGSDTDRMSRQQDFLASLVKKVRSNGVLMNPTKLFPVLDAATSSLTADSGLNSLTKLYDLVRGVRDIPDKNIHFLTVPRRPHQQNPNRDELVQPDADRLFSQLREDRPVRDGKTPADERDGHTATASPNKPDGPPGGPGTEATPDACD